MLLRRGNGYQLPPAGSGRHFDRAHHVRQDRIGRLMITLLLIVPAVWVLGIEYGWW